MLVLPSQNVRIKTPSAGIYGKSPAAGVLKSGIIPFSYSHVPNLKFWLETKDDSFIVKTGTAIANQTDRAQGIVLSAGVAPDDAVYSPAPAIFTLHDATVFDTFTGNQHLFGATPPSSAQTGSIFFVCYGVPLVDGEWLWSVSQSTLSDVYFGFKTLDVGGGSFRFAVHHVNQGTPTIAHGDTDISLGGAFLIELASQGTNWFMYVNGVLQSKVFVSGTENGNWFGDQTASDRICINQMIKSGADENGWLGALGLMLVYDGAVSVGDRARIYAQIKHDFPELGLP